MILWLAGNYHKLREKSELDFREGSGYSELSQKIDPRSVRAKPTRTVTIKLSAAPSIMTRIPTVKKKATINSLLVSNCTTVRSGYFWPCLSFEPNQIRNHPRIQATLITGKSRNLSILFCMCIFKFLSHNFGYDVNNPSSELHFTI